MLKRLERDGAKAGSKTAQGGASAGTKAAPMPQAAFSASTPPELSLDAGFPLINALKPLLVINNSKTSTVPEAAVAAAAVAAAK